MTHEVLQEIRAAALSECLRAITVSPMPIKLTRVFEVVLQNLSVEEEEGEIIPALFALIRTGAIKCSTGTTFKSHTVLTASPSLTQFVWDDAPEDEETA